MGLGASTPQVTKEELSERLTQTFAAKCFTPLELYSYRSVFKQLAERESGVRYWKEGTLCGFLELPEILHVGPVIFQICGYLGAFPFPSQAPAILTSDALLKVITILTERHRKIIKRPRRDWIREIYRSVAVYDKLASAEAAPNPPKDSPEALQGTAESSQGFAIDQSVDDGGEDADDDELLLAALESMDISETSMLGEKSKMQHSVIPSDNLLRLIELLVLIAPLEPQDKLSTFTSELDESRLEGLRAVAGNILSSFGTNNNAGVTYRNFEAVVNSSLPLLFDPLSPLFEHFLFDKDLDLSKKKDGEAPPSPRIQRKSTDLSARRASRGSVDMPRRKVSISMGQFGQFGSGSEEPSLTSPIIEAKPELPKAALLEREGDILNLNILSQLSFVVQGPSTLFRNLQPLYSGNEAGFSMGSFEKSVFKWQAPTILLVSGLLLPSCPTVPRQRTFADSLPPKRVPTSYGDAKTDGGQRVTYGAYVPVPWKHTPNLSISDTRTLLFQLAPHHAAFHASTSDKAGDHLYFCKSPATFTGVGFGSPLPSSGSSASAAAAQGGHRIARRSSWLGNTLVPIGPVSLHLDDGLEFAVFTHLTSGGGSFLPSGLPTGTGLPASGDWQDRFEIDALEVWGCGGTKEAEAQRQAWKWEEAEAERRRRVNLGTGDQEMDKELLKMAGIISDTSRSGGSMG